MFFIILYVIVISFTSDYLFAVSPPNKWRIENSILNLQDDVGTVKKSIELYDKKTKEPFKTKNSNTTISVDIGKVSRAVISGNGEIAVHVDREFRNYGEGATESTTSVRCFNSNGKSIWEKRAVDLDRGVHLSVDGKYALLVISSIDGCSSELDQNCTKTVIVVDNKGEELLKLGPYHTVGMTKLTKNGKYGMVGVWPGPKSDDLLVFFDVENRKIISKKSVEFSTKGSPRLLENGIVELVRKYYKDEAHRELDREEVMERFQIK